MTDDASTMVAFCPLLRVRQALDYAVARLARGDALPCAADVRADFADGWRVPSIARFRPPVRNGSLIRISANRVDM